MERNEQERLACHRSARDNDDDDENEDEDEGDDNGEDGEYHVPGSFDAHD